MAVRTCPHCRGHLEPGSDRCRWCEAPLPETLPEIRQGDVVRIRNPYKGGRVEEVTVTGVERGGYGYAVEDRAGMTWALIKPTEIVTVLKRARGA